MRIYDIIKKKRDGNKLNKEEIEFFIKGMCNGEIQDYHTTALLMAMFINGLSDDETIYLTEAMINSGDKIDLSAIKGIKVDKHSTGGVGDSITLVLAPLLAACGVSVAKMSGRGLGHTGGTLDKLESIPGFQIGLSSEKFIDSVNNIGVAVCGQTNNIVPADKKLYALRDVTATVDNYGLIASSIMSKKLACGADAIVLDVKCGSGAFMKNHEDAKELATEMIKIGKSMGKSITAFISDMSQPLGRAIGNSLEVIEAIEVLKGNGTKELRELAIEIATEMHYLSQNDKNITREESKEIILNALKSGKALEKMKEMIENQGGDSRVVDDNSLFKQAKHVHSVKVDKDAYIAEMSCEEIGNIAMKLGAGRKSHEDVIDMSAGIFLKKKIGDYIKAGETVAVLYTDKSDVLDELSVELLSAIKFSSEKVLDRKLIIDKLV